MSQAIGYGSSIEVQQIIPVSNDPVLMAGLIFIAGILCFLIVLNLWEIRKTKLYNPKMTKTIRVKIHE